MKWAWGLSAAGHGLLLLGAATVYTCWTAAVGPPGFDCRFSAELRGDPLPPVPDRPSAGPASPDLPGFTEDPPRVERREARLPDPGRRVIEEDEAPSECVNRCPGIQDLFEGFQDRGNWIHRRAEPPACQVPGAYRSRLASLANNRSTCVRLRRPDGF